MTEATREKISTCAILVGVALVVIGIGNGALSTPTQRIGTDDPKGIIWVWVVPSHPNPIPAHMMPAERPE